MISQVAPHMTYHEPHVAVSLRAYRVKSLSTLETHPAIPHRTSLITHCTIDRLPRLKALLLSWGGVASVAIYIKPNESIAPVMEFALELAMSTNIPALDVDLALVHGLHPSQEYPINTVRNVALVQARQQTTTLVFMVDVDFVISKGLQPLLNSPAIETLAETSLLVVPAFERAHSDSPIPETFDELLPEYKQGTTWPFHISHCKMCHGPTDYNRWVNDSLTSVEMRQLAYRITFQEFYEPYMVMRKDFMHLYDERFVGYGFNKQAQVLDMARSSQARNLTVVLREFIVAQEHPTTDVWKRLMTRQSWYRFKKIASYFVVKRDILQNAYQPILSRTTKSLLQMTSSS